MTLKERILAHPAFPKTPKELAAQVLDKGYEILNNKGQAEIRWDFVNPIGRQMFYYFYLDKDRNPLQTYAENLVVGTKFK